MTDGAHMHHHHAAPQQSHFPPMRHHGSGGQAAAYGGSTLPAFQFVSQTSTSGDAKPLPKRTYSMPASLGGKEAASGGGTANSVKFVNSTPEVVESQLARQQGTCKKKRCRTTEDQLRILQRAFTADPMPNAHGRLLLAKRLGMSARAVQVWFQNRRAKEKQEARRGSVATTSSGSASAPASVAGSLDSCSMASSGESTPLNAETAVAGGGFSLSTPAYPECHSEGTSINALLEPTSAIMDGPARMPHVPSFPPAGAAVQYTPHGYFSPPPNGAAAASEQYRDECAAYSPYMNMMLMMPYDGAAATAATAAFMPQSGDFAVYQQQSQQQDSWPPFPAIDEYYSQQGGGQYEPFQAVQPSPNAFPPNFTMFSYPPMVVHGGGEGAAKKKARRNTTASSTGSNITLSVLPPTAASPAPADEPSMMAASFYDPLLTAGSGSSHHGGMHMLDNALLMASLLSPANSSGSPALDAHPSEYERKRRHTVTAATGGGFAPSLFDMLNPADDITSVTAEMDAALRAVLEGTDLSSIAPSSAVY